MRSTGIKWCRRDSVLWLAICPRNNWRGERSSRVSLHSHLMELKTRLKITTKHFINFQGNTDSDRLPMSSISCYGLLASYALALLATLCEYSSEIRIANTRVKYFFNGSWIDGKTK